MKYRIVKNGLGEYAVQFRKLGFWCFWKEYDYFSNADYDPGIRRYFKSIEEAEAAITAHLAAKIKNKEFYKKSNTWGVVEK